MEPRTKKAELDFRKSLVTGILHIVLSVVSTILGIVALAEHAHLGYTGAGIWCAVFFLVAGVFGVTSWKYKTQRQAKFFMWFSVVAAIFAFVLLAVTGRAMAMDAHDDEIAAMQDVDYGSNAANRSRRDDDDDDDDDDDHDGIRNSADMCNSAYWKWCHKNEPLEILILVTGLLELVNSLTSFIVCCRSIGACAKRRTGSTSNVNPTPAHYVAPTGGDNRSNPTGQVVFMLQPNGGVFPVDQNGRPVHNGLPVYYMQPTGATVGPNRQENEAVGGGLTGQQNKANEAGMTSPPRRGGNAEDNPPPYSPPDGAVGGVDPLQSEDKSYFTKVDLSQF